MNIIGKTELWNSKSVFPSSREELSEPDGLLRIAVQKPWADDKFLFLHDSAIVAHKGTLFAAWYNCPILEMQSASAIRGKRSNDGGLSWGNIETIVEDKAGAGILYVPVAFLSFNGNLHAFISNMTGADKVTDCEIFTLDESKNEWKSDGFMGVPFLPNATPIQMDDGNFIMAGRVSVKPGDYPIIPAVAISRGDDITQWTVIPVSAPLEPFPESVAIVDGAEVTLLVRNDHGPALLFRSEDYGRSWKGAFEHNIPLDGSKIYAGSLSNGRHYLVANLRSYGRDLLALSVGEPGEYAFSRIWKLQDGDSKEFGADHQWSYPCACEFEDKLYIVSTCAQKRGDMVSRGCALYIVPIESLK